jgi:hypothetical protein
MSRRYVLGLVLFLCSPPNAGAEDPRVTLVRQSLQRAKSKLQSGHILYTQTTTYLSGYIRRNKESPSPSGKVIHTREYGFDRTKQHLLTRGEGIADSHYENANGTQFYNVHKDADGNESVRLCYTKRPVHFTNLLDFGYRIDGQWIADLVKVGAFKFIREELHPEYGSIMTIEGPLRQGIVGTISIARKTGLAMQYTRTYGEGDSITASVEEIMAVDGIPFPKRAKTMWLLGAHGQKEPYLSVEYVVEKAALNKVPAGFLDLPQLRPGATVKDDRVGKYFEVGSNGELIFRGYIDPPKSSGGSGAMQLGWVFILSSVMLLIGGVRFVSSRYAKKASGT